MFIAKMLFYGMFGICCLLSLYFFLSPVNNILYHPFVRTSENVIFLIAALVLSGGLYWSYQIVQGTEKYWNGFGVLVLGLIVSILIILIGLLFFNGPLKWN